ncbi:class I SAM-dependent methyltransferase [Pendulispora brunnea]|uniref:Class I SAM-dependent methyltransferase n=1 Tax=Pendulispora brunnea TaxID=2905690 RepID=A0ABZ2K1Z0_9BACT
MDPIAQLKETAKQAWASFAPTEMFSGSTAPRLVKFAQVTPGARVLDVACGTGVVGLTAARLGAKVTGLDLSPPLLERAKENASIMGLEIEWHQGDVEALPFEDASFDVVLSQFGHMFAPRPKVAIQEMLRVLRRGGTIAFSTWPPDVFVGKMFALTARYLPPPPPGVSPSWEWGDSNIVRERLGTAVTDLCFDRDAMRVPILSPQHVRQFMERIAGPVIKLVEMLQTSDPPKLAAFRRELDELASIYFQDNWVRQDFLVTRAIKA